MSHGWVLHENYGANIQLNTTKCTTRQAGAWPQSLQKLHKVTPPKKRRKKKNERTVPGPERSSKIFMRLSSVHMNWIVSAQARFVLNKPHAQSAQALSVLAARTRWLSALIHNTVRSEIVQSPNHNTQSCLKQYNRLKLIKRKSPTW